MLGVKSRIAFMRIGHGVAMGAGSVLLGALLAGCTIVQGDTSELDRMKSAPAQAAPAATPKPADALTSAGRPGESIASAGIPIPLMSPRHREFKVASIDPRAGFGTSGVPIRQLAGVYLKYGDALAVAEKSRLNTPKEVRRVLKDLRFAEPDTMATGWYAVRAMTAAQNKFFAQGVRDEVRRDGQDKVLAALDDPAFVLRIAGANAAITDVMASVTAENERMLGLRKRFLDTAMQFQRQKWGMNEPLAPAAETTVKAADSGTSASARFASLLSALSPIGEAQAYSPSVMTKILALAARQVMAAPAVPVAARRDETSACLNWARLNLNQCVAAAHFPSEEAWCAGTHAVEEVRTCWAAALPAAR